MERQLNELYLFFKRKSDFMSPKVLFICHPDEKKEVEQFKLKDVLYIDYKELYKYLDFIRSECIRRKIDLIAFSRNDQVKDRINIGGIIKKLRLGYTTFSAIEDQN